VVNVGPLGFQILDLAGRGPFHVPDGRDRPGDQNREEASSRRVV